MKKIALYFIGIILLFPVQSYAQFTHLGNASKAEGYIYEDCLLDDGTRYIMSGHLDVGQYGFSLCRFLKDDGGSWYGLAIESKEYIPKNGLMVIVPDREESGPVVLGQVLSETSHVSRTKSRLAPTVLFGSDGSNHVVVRQKTTEIQELSFAVFDISEDLLSTLIHDGVREIRISTRSTYNKLRGWTYGKIASYLKEAKANIDARARQSLNGILEDLD